jgi:hypothetical protein
VKEEEEEQEEETVPRPSKMREMQGKKKVCPVRDLGSSSTFAIGSPLVTNAFLKATYLGVPR